MFILRSLFLSIFVSLRMVPIILVVGASLAFVVSFLLSEPIALIMIVAAVYLPLTMFLYLNALRAGLMSLRAGEPPTVKKLWQATIRLMRFHFLVANMVFMLLGVGTTVIYLVTQAPETWDMLRNQMSLESLLDGEFMWELASRLPIGILIVWSVAISVAVGLVGVSAGATAAYAGVRGPNHDMLWGVTQKFLPLFALAFVVLVLPVTAAVFMMGGPLTGLDVLIKEYLPLLIVAPVFLAWVVSALCAGQALAYTQAVVENRERFEATQNAMMGEVVADDDLRALRNARQRQTEL